MLRASTDVTTTLLRNGIVLPMEGSKVVLDPGSVLFVDDTIVAVGTVEEVDAHPAAAGAEVVDATGMAVLPGLHNGHLHSGLLRGTAESMSLWDWLENYVDPAHKVMTPEIAKAASRLAYTEGLRFGTTSVMDMWRFMQGSAEVADELGVRATLVPYVADLPGYDYFETLETNLDLLRTHRTASEGRVRTWVGLEHLFYCSPEAFRRAAEIALEYDTGIHTHTSESIWEVQESLRRFGRRPVEEFYNRGILSDHTVIAHCVWLDDREIELLARTGTSAVHCPCSNMKLSSGPARVAERTRELADRLKEGLAGIRGVRLVTPRAADLSAGVVCCEVPGVPPERAVDRLRSAGVIASSTPYRPSYLRFGATIANGEQDVEAALRAVRTLV